MKIERKLVTPAMAKELLESNVKNRRVKEPVVLRYVNDMRAGKWKNDTAELIKISKTGIVLDGQHRLIAVVKANVPIWFHVATELEDSIFDILDTGSSRNAADVFKIEGIKYSTKLPSIIQLYETLKSNKAMHQKSVQKNFRHTNASLLMLYNDRVEFWQHVARKSDVWYNAFAKMLHAQAIGGMYAYFYDIDANDADIFMNQLCSGLDITNKTIYALRNKLMQDRLSVKKMPLEMKHSLIVKTWNHYRNGAEVSFLRFDPEKEKRPIAI